MKIEELQNAIGVTPDGKWGPASRAGLLAKFTNPNAPGVTDADIAALAQRLGCTPKQIKAVAAVESAGSGFDKDDRPKILFERHVFHRMTGGKFSPSPFSQPVYGGYNESSWAKLANAAGANPDAAFASCSWGRFQVLGSHWQKLGYASPFALAYSTVSGEAAHFDLLARYVQTFGLSGALRRISKDPEACRDFAKGYNGPQYVRFAYHQKLARAMA